MEAVKARKVQKEELNFTALLRLGVLQAVYFLLGLLVSRGAVLGELSPFGASLVAAVPMRFMAAAVLGGSLGYILLTPIGSFRYIAVLAAIGALRWLLSDFSKISKSRLFAPVLCFLTMVPTGLALTLVESGALADVGMSVIEGLLSATGAYFISQAVALGGVRRSLNNFTHSEVACLAVSFCILMLSLGGISLLGISLGRTLAVITVLLCARYGGVSMGSIGGVATGVVFSLGSTDMAFLCGGYAFGGLVAGLCSAMGRLPVGVAFTLCSTIFSVASGDGSLILSLFIEALLATGLYMLIPKDFGNTLRAAFSTPSQEGPDSNLLRKTVTARLQHTSRALEGVNECVTAVSERLKRNFGSDSDSKVFDAAAGKACKSCGLRAYCWSKQREATIDDFNRLSSTLNAEGFVSEKDIEETFTKKCCKPQELVRSINESYREHLAALAAERRISQVRSAVAGQFSGLSVMLADLSEELEDCESFDRESSERIAQELHSMGVVLIECSTRIDRLRRLTVELIIAEGREKLDRTELQYTVARACGRRFERALESLEGGKLRFVMTERSTYDVELGSYQHIAGGGSLCGDCLTYFSNGMGSIVAIISDGMGTGGAAAVDSNMAVSILEKLIKAGLSYDSALSVANSSLMIKSEEESMATVDIADLNLFTGKLSLFKAGAPLTLVKRSGRVLRREFPSLPVGILSGVRFKKDALTLHEGDMVLLVSDGAATGEDKWLEELLRSWQEAPAQDFAAIVVNEAMKRRREGCDDDITAIAMKVIMNEG